jgi:hypothetical protein
VSAPTDPDPWAEYTAALASLHAARDAAAGDVRAARAAQARRAEHLAVLGGRLAEQQSTLLALAADVRVPLTAAELACPAGQPGAGVGEVEARLSAAQAAVAEARRVAGLPQLLPAWSSPLARAAVVYAVLCVPNFLITVALAFTGKTESWLVSTWFLVVWPLLTASLGGRLVTHVSRPRATGDDDPLRQLTDLARRAGRWGFPYRALGVLIALASWLGPGFILEPDALWFG